MGKKILIGFFILVAIGFIFGEDPEESSNTTAPVVEVEKELTPKQKEKAEEREKEEKEAARIVAENKAKEDAKQKEKDEKKERKEFLKSEEFKDNLVYEQGPTEKGMLNGISISGTFTNNTSETLHYVFIKTYYFNAVGDRERNEIGFSRSTTHKLVGPVGPGESISLNGTGFYSYDTKSVHSFVKKVILDDKTEIKVSKY